MAKFRTNPKFQTCMTRQDVKDGHRAFVQAMFKWHKSMGSCLAGNECEDCPVEIQSDAASNDEALYFFKRVSSLGPIFRLTNLVPQPTFDTTHLKYDTHYVLSVWPTLIKEIDDDEDSDGGNESDQLKNSMRKCFKGVGKWQRQCQKESVKCEAFAK